MTIQEAIYELKEECAEAQKICGCKWNGIECPECHYYIAIDALEKQIPKKPYKVGFTAYECPKCHKFLHMVGYPCRCGQAIDWSDTE